MFEIGFIIDDFQLNVAQKEICSIFGTVVRPRESCYHYVFSKKEALILSSTEYNAVKNHLKLYDSYEKIVVQSNRKKIKIKIVK